MMRKHVSVLLALLLLAVAPALQSARADTGSPLKAAILRIALDWEHVKFEIENRDEQEQRMAAIAQRAAALAQQYPNRAEAAIWYGIIVSEQASMASENGSPVKALKLAYSARDILERAEKADPVVLDAGAPTSLGVLYYRVPGFPLGFGDVAKARHYLQEAVTNAPDGLDANYFYGDFLHEQKENAAATRVLQHVLALPPHPDRPIWDKSRRLVAQELLDKIAGKTQ